ncbi:unnamed protein product [Diabrotica balteata]|uniref:Uncharacterized protein n=1 Tax=Diabrotica balteata TaxID=107213 RepID=A0A9N9SRD5_DIABA|nr:unnamed protein product [Diabrotica balteata]
MLPRGKKMVALVSRKSALNIPAAENNFVTLLQSKSTPPIPGVQISKIPHDKNTTKGTLLAATEVCEVNLRTPAQVQENDTTRDLAVQTPSRDDTEKRMGIYQFLDSLPRMELHYCHAKTSKVYLEPMWESKSKLYREYGRVCQKQQLQPVSKVLFHVVFKNKNIGFFLPKKDQCEICLKHKLGKIRNEEYDDHQNRKVEPRNKKETDKESAENSSEVQVYAVDVQKVLQI